MSQDLEPFAVPSGEVIVSVVVVVKNALEELRRTIDSAHRLADPRLVLYVVDGASSDGAADYLAGPAPSPVTWISEPDKGIYDAMNKGWSMAAPDSFVLYLGAGDTLLSLPMDAMLERCLRAGRPLVLGECLAGPRVFESSWSEHLYLTNTAHHQALLVHKSAHPKPPFDASLRVFGDWDFNLRLFKSGVQAVHDSELRTTALPGGVSSRPDLPEVWRVALRHGGPDLAARSLLWHAGREAR